MRFRLQNNSSFTQILNSKSTILLLNFRLGFSNNITDSRGGQENQLDLEDESCSDVLGVAMGVDVIVSSFGDSSIVFSAPSGSSLDLEISDSNSFAACKHQEHEETETMTRFTKTCRTPDNSATLFVLTMLYCS